MSPLIRLLVVAAVAGVAFIKPARAQDAGPVIAAKTISVLPFKITKPGTYLLRANLVFKPATGAAITIDADGVTLDLGGRTLSSAAPNNNTNSTVGITNGGNAGFVTIRNGTIKGFKRGVFVVAQQVLVDRVNVWSSGEAGILVGAVDAEIRRCHVVDTGHVTASVSTSISGIAATLTGSVVIADNVVVDNNQGTNQQAVSIQASGGSGCSVLRNEVRNEIDVPGSVGIQVLSDGNFVAGNHLSHFDTGISFFGGASGKYQDNLTDGCNTAFSGGTSAGGNN